MARKIASKLLISALLLVTVISSSNCIDNQDNFVPYAHVDKYISLINYNNLLIPGNSMTFTGEGYAGLIVICISDQQYYAFDACCPNEGAKNAFVETNPGQTGIIFSSSPVATCKVCGSQYNLYTSGVVIKGPSVRSLKQYNVTLLDNRLWIHN
ncbi:MAG: Rieske 2Fe-2S domain-containing protein [Marinilabiliales bacterium]|nr:Rieske 2Fe-2S domain-containing protein [Marinilabiliales bacterium]